MKNLFILFSFTFLYQINSQTLLSIEDREIDVATFEKKYAQNIQFEGVEKSLNTFLEFELLKQDALNHKIDSTQNYRIALGKKRYALVKDFILEHPEMKSILEKYHKQNQTRLEVEFILVSPNVNFTAKQAKATAEALFQSYQNGSSIEEILSKNQVANVSGSSNYFVQGMKNHVDIESLFFNAGIGEIIPPQLLQGNYIFGKVLNKTDVNERISLRAVKINGNEPNAKIQANSAYTLLQKNVSFDSVLVQFTKDEMILGNRGSVPYDINMPKKILSQIKNLKSKEYAKPIFYNNDWYIIQLTQEPFCTDSVECMDEFLDEFIKSDRILRAEQEFYTNYVSKMVQPKKKEKVLDDFLNQIPNSFYTNSDSINIDSNQSLIQIKDRKFTTNELANILNSQQNLIPDQETLHVFIKDILNSKSVVLAMQEYKSNLQDYETNFAESLEQIKLNLLLLNYNRLLIEPKSKVDVDGQKEYYQNNQEKFKVDESFKGEIYACLTQKDLDRVRVKLKKGYSAEEVRKEFGEEVNENNRLKVKVYEGEFSFDDHKLPENLNAKKSFQTYQKNNKYYILKIKEILPQRILPFEQVRYELLNDYKTQFLLNRIEELKNETQYKFTPETVETLKAKYAN